MKNLLKLKKVQRFIEASKNFNWTSGYSQGELVQAKYFDGTKTSVIYEDDRRGYYKGYARKYEAKHGSLTLLVDASGPRTKYKVFEVSFRGRKTFDWSCESQRREDLKNGKLTMSNFPMFQSDFSRESLFKEVNTFGKGFYLSYYPKVKIGNYWEHSDVVFHAVEIENKEYGSSKVHSKWEELKKDANLKHHCSPCRGSVSEYLVNPKTGDIYRYSDHWGPGIRRCNWYLEGYDEYCECEAIGYANISEFQSNVSESLKVYNQKEVEELTSAIDADIRKLDSSKVNFTCAEGVNELIDKEIGALRQAKKEILVNFNLYQNNPASFFEPKIEIPYFSEDYDGDDIMLRPFPHNLF